LIASQKIIIMQEQTLHAAKHRKTFRNEQVSYDRGYSPARLNRMHRAMQRYIDEGWAPGIVTLVHHYGHEHVDTLGSLAFDSKLAMQRDTIFRLASMTKPVTAVATMILVEECRLRLDDPKSSENHR
jgi:CubicO group peptidase (beta-lactamase class C family)